jgi:CRISPR-associated endonuclease/helicase Cas3
MKAYPYQIKVAELLLAGKNVILQVPTGADKTQAALLPYITARFNSAADFFPRRCIYAVPTHATADQLKAEYQTYFDTYSSTHQSVAEIEKKKNPQETFKVTVQTRERGEDRKFEGDLIFTTIDQVLSSFLDVPYSLSNNEANINSAAIFSSYLVFDEFQLFPLEKDGSGALAITIEMLSWLKGITPFVLMTTASGTATVEQLCKWLDAETVVLSKDELEALPSQQKTRTYQAVSQSLNATSVLAKHTNENSRSIAICNTVAGAQELYRSLKSDPRCQEENIEVKLLCPLFLKEHHKRKEKWILANFGKEAQKEARNVILVTTQIIEVGFDISCSNLHTELATASSIVLRAASCARYEGEVGCVYIYYPRPVDDIGTATGKVLTTTTSYASPQAQMREATWELFVQRNGQVFSYQDELDRINKVHNEHDQKLLNILANSEKTLRNDMQAVMAAPSRATARSRASELIRAVDNIMVVIANPHQQSIPDPYNLEGFSFYRYSVQNDTFIDALRELAYNALEGRIGLWTPELIPDNTENSHKPPQFVWKPVKYASELKGRNLLFVDPALVKYDPELGFHFAETEAEVVNNNDKQVAAAPPFSSPKIIFTSIPPDEANPSVVESYQRHVGFLRNIYQRSYADEIAYVARKLEQELGLAAGMVDTAVRLTLACHDVGKFTEGWQQWAHAWQKGIGQAVKPEIMLAHISYQPSNPRHQDLEKQLKRPPHAVEGAIASNQLIYEILGHHPYLSRAVISAIARHHNADSHQASKFQLDKNASKVMADVLTILNKADKIKELNLDVLLKSYPKFAQELNFANGLVQPSERPEQFLYFLLVRVLRLVQAASIEES